MAKLPPLKTQGAHRKGNKPPPSTPAVKLSTRKWWEQEDSAGRAPLVCQLIQMIVRQNGNLRRQSILNWFRLYENYQAKGLLAGNYFRPEVIGRENHLTFNIVKSCVDTSVARVTEKEPKPTFMTVGGDWSDQKKAKLLDKFVQGAFYEARFPSKVAPKITRNAWIFGTGVAIVDEDLYERVTISEVFLEELLVDLQEAIYGTPRNLYRYRLYSRDVALGIFEGDAEAEEIIKTAPIAQVDPGMQEWADQSDLIVLFEAWHLPSGRIPEFTPDEKTKLKEIRAKSRENLKEDNPDLVLHKKLLAQMDAINQRGHNGRHVICTENGILTHQAWREHFFPVAVIDYTPGTRGWLNGRGIPEELAGIQYEINRVLLQMAEALPFCVPKLLIPTAANIIQDHLDDVSMGHITYAGANAPTLLCWEAIPETLFKQFNLLVQRAYELVGISQMNAAGVKPADLESGEALRTFDDIQGGRLFPQSRGYEELFLDSARLTIWKAKQIAERNGGSYIVKAPIRRRHIQRIDWSEIELDEDDYIMQVWPTSSLPRTPAGRLAMVNDLMTRGFLDKSDAIRLLNFPDLDSVQDLMEAAAEFTMWQLEQIIEHGKMEMPEPYQDLGYALRHAQSAYLACRTMPKMEEVRLDLLRRYIETCKYLAAKASQPPPVPGAQPGIPGGPPTMPAPGMPQAGAVPGGAPGAPGQAPPGATPAMQGGGAP